LGVNFHTMENLFCILNSVLCTQTPFGESKTNHPPPVDAHPPTPPPHPTRPPNPPITPSAPTPPPQNPHAPPQPKTPPPHPTTHHNPPPHDTITGSLQVTTHDVHYKRQNPCSTATVSEKTAPPKKPPLKPPNPKPPTIRRGQNTPPPPHPPTPEDSKRRGGAKQHGKREIDYKPNKGSGQHKKKRGDNSCNTLTNLKKNTAGERTTPANKEKKRLQRRTIDRRIRRVEGKKSHKIWTNEKRLNGTHGTKEDIHRQNGPKK